MITAHNYKFYDLFHPMMRTEELSSKDFLQLVAEAYAAFYLRSWIIRRAKEYMNPFGKFNWMLSCMGRLIKQGVIGGLGMLYTQGITTRVISDELRNPEELMKNIYISSENPIVKEPKESIKPKILTHDKIREVISEQT